MDLMKLKKYSSIVIIAILIINMILLATKKISVDWFWIILAFGFVANIILAKLGKKISIKEDKKAAKKSKK